MVASVAEAADRAYDYVVLTTKALPEVQPASSILAAFLDKDYAYPQPTYVLMQNGMGVEDNLYDALQHRPNSRPRILTCAVYLLTNMLGNVVKHGPFVSKVLNGQQCAYQHGHRQTSTPSLLLESFVQEKHQGPMISGRWITSSTWRSKVEF